MTLGIGRAVKRDALIVKVTTESGLIGWGESHHGRAPGAIAQLINTTLCQLTVGMGWPLYKLLGGSSKPTKAYAGGISLGFQPAPELVVEAQALCERGYRALKLRFGDSPKRDIERLVAVRKALGDEVVIMVDANTGYILADVRAVMPVLDELSVIGRNCHSPAVRAFDRCTSEPVVCSDESAGASLQVAALQKSPQGH